jgi:hypothetical protein
MLDPFEINVLKCGVALVSGASVFSLQVHHVECLWWGDYCSDRQVGCD